MALIKKDGSDNHLDILLAKYLARETNEQEAAIIDTWIQQDAVNKKYTEQLQLIWQESKKISCGRKPDVQKALIAFRERTTATPTITKYKMHWWQAAAIVLFIAGVATIITISNNPRIKQQGVLHFVAGNTPRTDTLPDGSVVQLQPHAELSLPALFTTGQRIVALKGDACFSVSHDANHPFQISVNDLTVIVLGTSFTIADLPGSTEVDVITGIVQVTKAARSIQVFPHEKLIVPATGNVWTKQRDTLPPVPSKQEPLPQNGVKPSLTIKPGYPTADSIINDEAHQRQVMVSILNDLIKERLVPDRKSIVWAALTESLLIVNGEKKPDSLHQQLKAKYRIVAAAGYYYGPVQITGKGYFFDASDFK